MTEVNDPGFGIYIHWPFCASKCPYCDFNSHVRKAGIDEASFVDAYCRELETYRGLLSETHVDTVFFGGGTPSLMSVSAVERILNSIAKQWRFSPNIEITLEANPTSVDAGRFAGYRKAGVNRLSLGVQSLRDRDLRFLGRLHTVEEAMSAINLAKSIFERTSFDLIYARPGQSPGDWRQELKEALQFQNGHLSLYQLTIEPETAFADLYSAGKLSLPRDDTASVMYELTREECERFGLLNYEVSNYAVKGLESQHNMIYWCYGNYIGLGPGAHGRMVVSDQTLAVSNIRNPEDWKERVSNTGIGSSVNEEISSIVKATEFVLMGLRLKQGVNLLRLEQTTGYGLDLTQKMYLIEENLIEYCPDESRLCATPSGTLVLNSIIKEVSDVLYPLARN